MRPLHASGLLALVLLVAAPARAAPEASLTTAQAAAWDAAEAEMEALRRGDDAAALRCADGFLALHIELPSEHPRAVVSLHNAARCQAAAGLWDDAARSYLRVVTRWPDSELAPRALAELALGHEAVGRYAEAADFAEQYAARDPGTALALDLLRSAYRMRVGLGQRDRALAVLDRLESRFLRDDPHQAAQIFWARGDLMRDDRERLEHAMAYLKRHGKHGPRDLRIVASAQIGALQWRAACDKGVHEDLCVTIKRRRRDSLMQGRPIHHDRERPRPRPPAPPTCEPPTSPTLTLYPRDPRRAAEARRWLSQAIELARRDPVTLPADNVQRVRAYHDALAMAALHLADAQFEELLALDVPTRLSFADRPGDPRQQRAREDSLRRLREYLASTQALTQTLERQYGEIAATRTSPRATIAALTRLAQLAEYRAAILLLADLPVEVRDPSAVAAYCQAMREYTDPLLAAAVATYARSLDLSTATGDFTDFSRLAEATLQLLDRQRWPEAAELFGQAQYTAPRPEAIGVVTTTPRLIDTPAARE